MGSVHERVTPGIGTTLAQGEDHRRRVKQFTDTFDASDHDAGPVGERQLGGTLDVRRGQAGEIPFSSESTASIVASDGTCWRQRGA